jgi:hypothetical protein
VPYTVEIIQCLVIQLKTNAQWSFNSDHQTFFSGALEELGLKPIMQILENVSLPKQIPNSKTAKDWDIAKTLAQIQRIMSQDFLVQLGPDLETTDDGKIVLNVSTA